MVKKSHNAEGTELLEADSITEEDITAVDADFIIDFISGKTLSDTPKEKVRQQIARGLANEYSIPIGDMEIDFKVRIGGRNKKIDIAIFHLNQAHAVENLSRAVVCRQEPKVGKNPNPIRDSSQAERDLEELKAIMTEIDSCRYGLWTNGLEFFYLLKDNTSSKFETRFEDIGDWPLAGESELATTSNFGHIRKADPDMLRITFKRCHNYIHGNEGMPKDAAFWQFLYLIFCKMYDEATYKEKGSRQFWAGPKEQFDVNGRKEIRKRIFRIFEEVKKSYGNIFHGNEEITLSDRALAFMVSELYKYDLTRTDVDAKGAAYQEIVGTNLRGDKGQYFTPRGVVKLAVEMLNPKTNEIVLDPACGTGGFLVNDLAFILKIFREKERISIDSETTEEFLRIQDQLKKYAENNAFGADFDPFLIKASQMNMAMSGDGHGHLYHINSLEFPSGHLEDVSRASKEMPLANPLVNNTGFDIVMTNPPFGSDIPITERQILQQFELARKWEGLDDGSFRNTGVLESSVSPEILFIERCIQWLKPGGRMAIVLPDGILGNPGNEYIRWWILQKTWVVASVDLPVEVFIVEANVNILTSVLFLVKKSDQEIRAERLAKAKEYPIFMAVAEKVGFDRRGKVIYKRRPDGEDIVEVIKTVERIVVNGETVSRPIHRKQKTIDNDLVEIPKEFLKFLKQEAPNNPHLRAFL
jgi:type I restriction enzyme M protein